MNKTKKKRRFHALDAYVIFSICVLIIYTIVSQVLASVYMVQLDALTACFFAAFGGEILSACLIKIFKLHKETGNSDDEGGVVG